MEKIDLSTNSRQIQDVYDHLVRGDPNVSFIVYTVDKGTLTVDESGNGDLTEFVSYFGDGHVLFGLARVTVPGSDVTKILLVGWCPDNAPAKSRLLFAANFADVSKILAGYHVQVTARDADDLDVDELILRVGAAAGARYSVLTLGLSLGLGQVAKPAAKPFVPKAATKPAPAKPSSFVPRSTGKPISKPNTRPTDDGWEGQEEIEERDFQQKPLLDLPSAYKPTKVDIALLRKGKSDTISSKPAVQKPETQNDELGKVQSLSERMAALPTPTSSDGRLTSLPKHKVSNSVALRFNANVAPSSTAPKFGAKPALPLQASEQPSSKVMGGLLRNFGSENGKTPAQIWAEKRGQYKTVIAEGEAELAAESPNQFSAHNIKVSENARLINADREEYERERSQMQFENAQEDDAEEEIEQEQEEEMEAEVEEQEGNMATSGDQDTDVDMVQKGDVDMEDKAPAPVPTPARSLPPAPVQLPARNLPPAPAQLPARNLPPPPIRQVVPEAVSEPVSETVAAPKSVAEPAPSFPSRPAAVSGPCAVAEYDYEKDEDNEVGFEEGDRIVAIEFVDEEWWQGTNEKTGESGLFPAAYVVLQESQSEREPAVPEPVEAKPAPAVAAVPEPANAGPTAIAEYDYEKDEDNEVAFEEGDRLVGIEFVDDEWWQGVNEKTGESGLFPANYVTLQQ